MEPPDFFHDDFDDEDAMINDYIEDGTADEPPASPPPYDDDTEWMEVGRGNATSAAAAAAAAASDLVPNEDPNDPMEVVDDGEDTMSDDEDHHEHPTSTVHLNFARKRRKQKDPYAFERYQGENSDNTWRAGKNNSPSTMRAKSWKMSKARNPLSSLLLQRRKEVAPNAPDAQLLSFLRGTTVPLKHKIRMPGHPVPGKTCVSLTLGDGTRLFCPNQQPEDASQLVSRASQQSFDSPLGVSIGVLMQRVQSTRRKREHAKLQLLCPSSGSHDEMQENGLNSSSTRISTSGHHDQLWVDKHAPHSFAHLLSDERANREVVRALREWDPYVFHRDPPKRPEAYAAAQQAKNSESQESKHNNKNIGAIKFSKNPKDKRPAENHRVILLSGSPGVGKTTLAHIVARHVGYRPVEVNGSDERSESALTERVIRAMESTTLQFGKDNNKPNCLILDEIDGADAARSIQALVNIIRAEMPTSKGTSSKHSKSYLRRPIIFICNNKFAPALKPLLPFARQFTVHPPSPTRLVARLRSILADERLACGSAALLNQLVEVSGGDIRSCLYTLQFASAKSRRDHFSSTSALTDIANALVGALGGDSLKDKRNDVVGTLTTIFRKEKEGNLPGSRIQRAGVRSTEKVLDAVQSYGDSSKILDSLFLNTLRVSYVDPTLDRCAAAHEWMSSADIYRSNRTTNQFAMEALHIPAATGAIHLLCRVEQRQDLTYSTRELVDAHFLHESNIGLAQKFFEGLSLQTRGARGVPQLASEIVPYALWMLSAGEGSSALDRVATSVDLLSKGEQMAFRQHAATLRALGLSYVKEEEESVDAHQNFRHMPMKVRLEPPIEQFVKFSDLQVPRREIPAALKQLLCRQAAHDRMIGSRNSVESTELHASNGFMKIKPTADIDTAPKKALEQQPKRAPPVNAAPPPAKKAKAQNFLIAGAKQAKAARSARTAARVGVDNTKTNKLSNTGSGVPISKVVRLKYVKGFTQAVRTPCRMADL